MENKAIKILYDKYCYDKINCTYNQWAELISKFPDDDVKQAFVRKEIDCYSSLENALVDTLPEKKRFNYYGYKDLEDMRNQIRAKLDKLKQKGKP